MALVEDTDEGEILTGAELFHYLTKQNEQQLAENRRKQQEYVKLQEILQRITDRCRVPILAPVAGGLGYFESTINYTNNILVFLGDGWFAERSAKQACEIAGRRLEFLSREESALVVEAAALMERQNLFLLEVPQAERAMAEVQALKEDVLRGGKGDKGSDLTVPAVANTVQGTTDRKPNEEEEEEEARGLHLGPEEEDLAVIDDLDYLTEDELLQIEEELGERVEDDELVERVMMEKLILKKEKRVREALRQKQIENAQPPSTAAAEQPLQKEEEVQKSHDDNKHHDGNKPLTSSKLAFTTPGDIGRVAAAVMRENSPVNATGPREAKERHVRFSSAVDVVLPEDTATTARLSDVSYGGKKHFDTCDVLGEVVERDTTLSRRHTALTDTAKTAGVVPKKKSLFLSELEGLVCDRQNES